MPHRRALILDGPVASLRASAPTPFWASERSHQQAEETQWSGHKRRWHRASCLLFQNAAQMISHCRVIGDVTRGRGDISRRPSITQLEFHPAERVPIRRNGNYAQRAIGPRRVQRRGVQLLFAGANCIFGVSGGVIEMDFVVPRTRRPPCSAFAACHRAKRRVQTRPRPSRIILAKIRRLRGPVARLASFGRSVAARSSSTAASSVRLSLR